MSDVFRVRCRRVKMLISEIKGDIYGYLNEIKNVEEKAEIEQKSVLSETGELNKFSCNSKGIADYEEYLEKEALALCGTAYIGFTYGYGPGKTEAKDGKGFKKVDEH